MWSILYSKALFVTLTATSAAAFARSVPSHAAHARAFSVLVPRGGTSASSSTSSKLYSTSTSATDTPTLLPDFASKEEYLTFMEGVSALPKGFATGTAKGTFISVEAPLLGALPIKGTVIYLTEGPTDNWAAVFTKNRVRA
jgi:hypothetical protein